MASYDWLPPSPPASQIDRSGDGLWRSKGNRPLQCSFISKVKSTVTDYAHTTVRLGIWTEDWLKPPALATIQQVDSRGPTVGYLRDSNENNRVPNRMAGDNTSSRPFWIPTRLGMLLEQELFDDGCQDWNLMQQQGMHVSSNILHCLLDECIGRKDLAAGRELHCCIVRCGHDTNAFLGSHLIRMFALCGSLLEAKQIFSKLSKPDLFTWSAIISAHTNLGQGRQAIKLYHQMQQSCINPDGHVFAAVLKACATTADLVEGKLIHAQIMQSGMGEHVFIGNTLIDMYTSCGSFQAACTVFDKVPERDVVTWNAMMAGLAQHGCGQEAFQLFEQMQQEGIQPNQGVLSMGMVRRLAKFFKECSRRALNQMRSHLLASSNRVPTSHS